MKALLRRLRYLGYAAVLLLWFTVMLTPCFAVVLATRGELEWKRGDYDSDRIWLIQERDQRGLGYHAQRLLSDERATGGLVCVNSSARFILWEGAEEGMNNDYCECYAADGSVSGGCK